MARNYKKKGRKVTSPKKLEDAAKLVNDGWAVRAAARQLSIPKSCLWEFMQKMKKDGVEVNKHQRKHSS